MKEELTLFELNEFIKRFVALNVPESIWITAEISQANLSRGNYYIDLIQKSEVSNEILAQSYAVLWGNTLGKIAPTKTSNITQILKQGLKVKLRVQVSFHEKFGLKLIVEDIDENYTYGNLALERAKIIKRLQAEKLLEKNRLLTLPKMIKRIAVLSSKTAAGFKDFITHLDSNEYSYTFGIELFPMAMQGTNTEGDFLLQISKIDWKDFDMIVVIRGGGSKIDLAAFDSYEICKAIANCPTPVLTGIGHEIDETIADMVSHTSLKTPTAVASFIIDKNLELESLLVQMNQEVVTLANRLIQDQKIFLRSTQSEIPLLARQTITNARHQLAEAKSQVAYLAANKFKMAKLQIEHWQQTVQFLSIENTLGRGFTLTRNAEGKPISQSDKLKKGDVITTQFHKGEQKSRIE